MYNVEATLETSHLEDDDKTIDNSLYPIVEATTYTGDLLEATTQSIVNSPLKREFHAEITRPAEVLL